MFLKGCADASDPPIVFMVSHILNATQILTYGNTPPPGGNGWLGGGWVGWVGWLVGWVAGGWVAGWLMVGWLMVGCLVNGYGWLN